MWLCGTLSGPCTLRFPFLLHDFFGGQWFHDEESLKKAVINFFEKKDLVWHAAGSTKLTDRYKKDLTRYSDYVK